MPQNWDMGQILSFPLRRKACGGLRPGLNPRTRVPEASMLTTRPPKPSPLSKIPELEFYVYIQDVRKDPEQLLLPTWLFQKQ